MSRNKKIMALFYQTKWCLRVKDEAEGSKDGNNSNAESQQKCGLKSQVPEEKVYRNLNWS